jgi:hypothetical protein
MWSLFCGCGGIEIAGIGGLRTPNLAIFVCGLNEAASAANEEGSH